MGTEPKPSKAALKALRRAVCRPRGTICPVVGVHAAAETQLLESLIRNGWANMDGPTPYITAAGIALVGGAS